MFPFRIWAVWNSAIFRFITHSAIGLLDQSHSTLAKYLGALNEFPSIQSDYLVLSYVISTDVIFSDLTLRSVPSWIVHYNTQCYQKAYLSASRRTWFLASYLCYFAGSKKKEKQSQKEKVICQYLLCSTLLWSRHPQELQHLQLYLGDLSNSRTAGDESRDKSSQ